MYKSFTFSDGSELAHGAVSYLRFTNTDGDVQCLFLMSKTHLSPLKTLSVPCLGSTAATLAMKLDKKLSKELDVPIRHSDFWADSTSVLCFIQNEDKCFHTFYACSVEVCGYQAKSLRYSL